MNEISPDLKMAALMSLQPGHKLVHYEIVEPRAVAATRLLEALKPMR